MIIDRPGKLSLNFESNDGEKKQELVFDFPSPGVALSMYNLDESIRGFARACFNYGLKLQWPVYLSTKDTILKKYDSRSSHLEIKSF